MNNKTVFITYADFRFKKSAKRLCSEAKAIDIFSQVRIYDNLDLPDYIKNLAAFNSPTGGGFWIWKPYIILDKLKKLNWGDTLVYADAGCKFYQSNDWEVYLKQLNVNDAIFFQYKDMNYSWGSPTLKHWMKKSAIDYFQPLFEDKDWIESTKFWAGFIIVKKTPKIIELIEDWLNIMMYRQDLLVDIYGVEKHTQADYFVEHRHDQSILSAILLANRNSNIKYLYEDSDVERKGQAVFAARLKDIKTDSLNIKLKKNLKQLVKYIFMRNNKLKVND